MTFTVSELEKHHAIKNGKPSISMGHRTTMAMLVIGRLIEGEIIPFIERWVKHKMATLNKNHGEGRFITNEIPRFYG